MIKKLVLALFFVVNMIHAGADLDIASFNISPNSFDDTDSITFTLVVKNIGDVTASSFKLYIRNSGIDKVKYYVLRHDVPAMAPQATHTIQDKINIDIAQEYLSVVVIDYDDEVAEDDETNNTDTLTFEVQASPKPDLDIISYYMSPETPHVKDTITFTSVVKNIGDVSANPFKLSLRVGSETPPKYDIPALAPQETYTVQRKINLNIAQRYLSEVIADCEWGYGWENGNVVEYDELNNTDTLIFEVKPAPKPDLDIISYNMSPAQPHTRDTITFTAVVKNMSTDPVAISDPFKLSLRVGSESLPPKYDIPVLAPQETYTVQRKIKLNIAQWYLSEVIADCDWKIGEVNELNNTDTLIFEVRRPALAVQYDTTYNEKKDTTTMKHYGITLDLDTLIWTIKTENCSSFTYIETDSLANGVSFFNKIDTTVAITHIDIDTTTDTLYYVPILTVNYDTTNHISKDTVAVVDSVVLSNLDTLITTIYTENCSSYTFIKTDSLSDGESFFSKIDTSVIFIATDIDTTIDTIYHVPVITVNYDTTNHISKDTVTMVDSVVLSNLDTLITTVYTENCSAYTYIETDSLSDDVSFFSKVDTSVIFTTLKFDTTYDTLEYDPPVMIEVLEVKTVMDQNELVFAPNPVPANVDEVFFITPSSLPGEWEVLILDNMGSIVDRQNFYSAGGHTYRWNLKNLNGVPIASGTYVAVIKINKANGKIALFKKKIGVQR